MKTLLILLITLASTAQFAFADVSYTCNAKDDAINVGLPERIFVTVEGQFVTIQNSKDDLYYDGKLDADGLTAKGYSGLIIDKDGYVRISSRMKKERRRASLTIHDNALDSANTRYSCKKD